MDAKSLTAEQRGAVRRQALRYWEYLGKLVARMEALAWRADIPCASPAAARRYPPPAHDPHHPWHLARPKPRRRTRVRRVRKPRPARRAAGGGVAFDPDDAPAAR